jgi:hypothetical protein
MRRLPIHPRHLTDLRPQRFPAFLSTRVGSHPRPTRRERTPGHRDLSTRGWPTAHAVRRPHVRAGRPVP